MHIGILPCSILASSPERLIYLLHSSFQETLYESITHLEFGYRIDLTLILLYLSHTVQLQLTNVIH